MGKNKNKRSATERYHDRVAHRYDDIYKENPYWEFYNAITWEHIKQFLPIDINAPCVDLGCGTGLWGLKIAKSGFPVTFVDISKAMVEQVRQKFVATYPHLDPDSPKFAFIHADIANLAELPAEHFAFATAQGDPLSLVDSPARAVAELKRILRNEGTAVISVDNRAAGFWYYLQQGDMEGLEDFAQHGLTHWLTQEKEERYKVKMFLPEELKQLFEKAGFQVVDLIGKTVLDLRRFDKLLEERNNLRRLLRLESDLHRNPSLIGLAGHLEIVVKKK